MLAPGPFQADQIKEGSPYELSNGHAILCLPTGRRGGVSNLLGGSVVGTDPAVKTAGVDVGFSPAPSHLRAPDVAVGDFAFEPGWAPEAPPLALEYADTGQDESELQQKIAELLVAGTKYVWVVRLVAPRRVEVYERGRRMRIAQQDDVLTAPGVLKNPVPVLALFDQAAAYKATLRNLLQREGYESVEAVRQEGKQEGKQEGELEGRLKGQKDALLAVLSARGLAVSEGERATILEAKDAVIIERWIVQAATADSVAEALATPDQARR
jgi:Uma2 family endonuclease